MIEALVFDFDGVIIDTETSDFQTWADVFDSHGAHLDRSLWTEFIGRGSHIFDIYDHLEAEVGRPLDRDAIRAARRDRHMELVEASPVLPGVLDLLREVDEQGIPRWGRLQLFPPVGGGTPGENRDTGQVRLGAMPRRRVGHQARPGALHEVRRGPGLLTGAHRGHRGLPQRHRGSQGRRPLLRRRTQPHDPRPAHRRSRRTGGFPI